jgi:hypothetical protein
VVVLDRLKRALRVDGDLDQHRLAGRLVMAIGDGFSRGRA